MTRELLDQALVLRRVAYGESDWIVTLLCRAQGKVSALARAARRSQRRFGGALELGTISRVTLRPHPRSEMWTLVDAAPAQAFALGQDLTAFSHASYGVELVRELCPAEQPDPRVFDLTVELFAALATAGGEPFRLRAFELALLDAVGLALVLDRCAACGLGDEALERGAVFDVSRGGALCIGCAAESRGLGVRPIGALARRLLDAAARTARLADAGPSPAAAAVQAEARDAVVAALLHHIGKPLRSVEFIAKMSAGPGS